MSVHCGFFNADNGDRVYDADDMGNIFDGMITDGVYPTVGEGFKVEAAGAEGITVGTGRGWFWNKWIYNDAALQFPVGTTRPSTTETQIWKSELPASHMTLNRYDAVVIQVGKANSVRNVEIVVKSGIAAQNPAKPGMAKSANTRQYPLAYIYRAADTTTVKAADVSYEVGSTACPWAAFNNGVLTNAEIDAIMV